MKKIGIIVARFQVPSLHAGHVHFILEAAEQVDHLVIFLGYTVNQPDIKNPFSLAVRKAMLMQTLRAQNLDHKVHIDTLQDHPVSNEAWSEELDAKIHDYEIKLHTETKDDVEVTLFGSRDSFIKYYHGKYTSRIIEEKIHTSGTAVRNAILSRKEDELSDLEREGMIYAMKQLYPVGMSVVDVAVYKQENDVVSILVGRKPREKLLRLIGGFFDVSVDNSLEDAALREMREEVGDISVGVPQYVISKKVDDWRYRDNQHKIVSSLFIVDYRGGEPHPHDDIEELVWINLDNELEMKLVESHRGFFNALIESIPK